LNAPLGRIRDTREFRFPWSIVTAKVKVLPQSRQVTARFRFMGSTRTSAPHRQDTLSRGFLGGIVG
jgi:hypothetical protein